MASFPHREPVSRQRVTPQARSSPRLIGGAAASLAILAAITAAAAASKVSIRLEGEILPECAIAGGVSAGGAASFNLPLEVGDVGQPGQRTLAFGLNCNAPFNYRLEAQYGTLTHAGARAAPRGFTTAVPYDVAVHIPTDGAPIDDRCTGQSLAAGRVTCPFSVSGSRIALGSRAELTIRWRPAGEMPLAGAYVERLTVMVATSL